MMQVRLAFSTLDIAHLIKTELRDLGAHIYKIADSGSVYLKFERRGLGSVRISTHHGMLKYKYRWNLRKDLAEPCTEVDRGVIRHYIPWNQLDEFYKKIRLFVDTMPKAEGENYYGSITEKPAVD